MCSWCRNPSVGSRCNTRAETCQGSIDEYRCVREPTVYLGLTAVIVTMCLFCLLTCYCNRVAVGNFLYWLYLEVKGNNEAYRREEIGRHYDGGSSSTSAYRTGRGRHGSNPRAELRPGQQELMMLRRQWHAQRAAREAAREAAEARGEAAEAEIVQSYRNQRLVCL